MKHLYFISFFMMINHLLIAQIELIPNEATANEKVILRFDASIGGGELIGSDKVYMHHGVVLSGTEGTEWNNVIGNWGADDGIGLMKKVTGRDDLWEIEISPDAFTYFGVSTTEQIFRISAVFRNSDGSLKASFDRGVYDWGEVISNGDAYVNLQVDNYIAIASPKANEVYLVNGVPLSISTILSSKADMVRLYIDKGQGFNLIDEKSNIESYDFNYNVEESAKIIIKIQASINGEMLEAIKELNLYIRSETVFEQIEENIELGVNYYDESDRVSLALLAPKKEFVYVVGDFNNWEISDEYLMKYDSTNETFWLTIEGLIPGEDYVYQYWVDGIVKIGDPYAEQIADPWNDKYILENVFPNLPKYENTDYGTAAVLNTLQQEYVWSSHEANWVKPKIDELIIYELLIRDFVASHSYEDLIDSLEYLSELGINAIELMPINEFEGNESWGYNPSYFFAPDKYYGTKNELKRFIDAAHQKGIAVILDIVLNHAYGQSPLVEMYFDTDSGNPSKENPWFNQEYVGPYSWGYDFNHESIYTQNFIDDINEHWLTEYHFDGYRFDFTKGFTNYAPGNSLDNYDQSRIDILKRMGNKIRSYNSDAYLILEHWASPQEENELALSNFIMWRNKSYDFVPASIGSPSGTFEGADAESHVVFFNSHDERRLAEHMLTEGRRNSAYNIQDTLIMLERIKMAAAFQLLLPGPKMMWMFDELAYDVHIDFNGRVGNKPLPWGEGSLSYYDNVYRQYVYDAYRAITKLRSNISSDRLRRASKNHKLQGSTRRLAYDMDDFDLVVVGNFSTQIESINPAFPVTGEWYDYFSGESFNVNSTADPIELNPGEWHIYTSNRLSEGLPNVVEHWENPVTISPFPFTSSDEIIIEYDTNKGSKDNTEGLTNADKVYIHSGIYNEETGSWSNIVGNLVDDNLGLMSKTGENKWQLVMTPQSYYNSDDIDNIIMYFRDADNNNVGKGFRGQDIIIPVESVDPFVQIIPSSFDADDRITITFNAERGNGELINVDKVYMHSSMDITNTNEPQESAWGHVVGNWGQDDGIGKMSKVSGTDNLWEISLVPRSYYGLSQGDHPYWLAAVFRSADGTKKGTGNVGELPNGFIHDNLDFFIKNDFTTSLDNIVLQPDLIYPNPATHTISINTEENLDQIIITNSLGEPVRTIHGNATEVDVSHLSEGVYLLIGKTHNKNFISKFIKI